MLASGVAWLNSELNWAVTMLLAWGKPSLQSTGRQLNCLII